MVKQKNKIKVTEVFLRPPKGISKLPDILPCPFCGSDNTDIELESMCKGDIARVVCNDCKSCGPEERDNGSEIAEILAIRAWNWSRRNINE